MTLEVDNHTVLFTPYKNTRETRQHERHLRKRRAGCERHDDGSACGRPTAALEAEVGREGAATRDVVLRRTGQRYFGLLGVHRQMLDVIHPIGLRETLIALAPY